MKKFKFDRREDYKRMKQKDRSQLENAINAECEKAYQKGYEAGRKATVFPSEIAVAISGIKGVGKKKREEIMECLTSMYEERMKGAKENESSIKG